MKYKANLIIYSIPNKEALVYLSRRSKTATMYPNYFSFFGGKIEDEETSEDALKREIKEELNITLKKHDLLGIFETPGSIKTVFFAKFNKKMIDKITPLEGQYGRWFDKKSVSSENMIINKDKEILFEFFNKITSMK